MPTATVSRPWSRYFSYVCTIFGISPTQTVQDVAQKFTSTTLPLSDDRANFSPRTPMKSTSAAAIGRFQPVYTPAASAHSASTMANTANFLPTSIGKNPFIVRLKSVTSILRGISEFALSASVQNQDARSGAGVPDGSFGAKPGDAGE